MRKKWAFVPLLFGLLGILLMNAKLEDVKPQAYFRIVINETHNIA